MGDNTLAGLQTGDSFIQSSQAKNGVLGMHRIVGIDAKGRIIVMWERPTAHNEDDESTVEKHKHINHLRRMQSTNFVGRSALKLRDLFTANRAA